jgi:hypothetical protein
MALLGALGGLSLTAALTLIGALSGRLAAQAHDRPRYRGFYLAALLMLISSGARLLNEMFTLVPAETLSSDLLWIILYSVLPAVALTLGAVHAWHFWSWLLAERG